MKKILCFILISCFFSLSSVWNVFSQGDTCGEQSGFNRYNCRIENICENYKSEKPAYNTEDYEEADGQTPEFHGQQSFTPALDNAKALYRENMGNIYKCAIIQAQKNSLEFLKKQLSAEESGQLDDTIGGQIDLRVSRLDLSANRIGCALTNKDQIFNKLNVLKETTYEACRYVNYLEYLKSYYASTENQLNTTERASDSLVNSALPQMVDNAQNAIASEIAHTYKVFPIAFQAYSEYENNFPIHFLLEIIRWDFLLLRQGLYETLMPVAQLGLKVINAMSY